MLPKPITNLHRHHIIPRHMGGTDVSSNIVFLTVQEHANAHKLLWESFGHEEDYIAWKALEGQMSKSEAIKKAIINSNKTRVVSEETKKKIGLKSKERKSKLNYVTSEETKQKIRNSVLKTLKNTDYIKCRRIKYEITFPNGEKQTTDNIEKFCTDHPEMPSACCIRTQHHRKKTEWKRGQYAGFKIVKIQNETT